MEEQRRTVQLGTEEASDVVVEGSSDPDRPSDANSGAGDEIHRIFFPISCFLFFISVDWFVQFGGATCCCRVLVICWTICYMLLIIIRLVRF